MFADYYKQHDKYRGRQRDGYQTVGDIAYRDDEGYVYICDRKKDMIISGGMNIYPAEIEAALEAAPRHLRGGGVRHPAATSGARSVHAVVVLRPGRRSSDADVDRATPREHLASYKIPRSVVVHATSCPRPAPARSSSASCARPYWAGRTSQVG